MFVIVSPKTKKILRWGVLALLLSLALLEADRLGIRLSQFSINTSRWPVLLGLALACHGVQGLLTRQLAQFAGVRLGRLEAVALNATGGLWSLLFPLGAVGYKAIYLKKQHQLSWRMYSSFFGFSLVAAFACAGVGVGVALIFLKAIYWGLGLLFTSLLFVWLFCKMGFWLEKKLPARHQFWLAPFKEKNAFLQSLQIMALQGAGLGLYTCLYLESFRAMGAEQNPVAVLLLVCAQSLLMLVTFVPGNLVVLEAFAGTMIRLTGGAFGAGAVAALINRLSLLAGILLLGLLLQPFLKKEKFAETP